MHTRQLINRTRSGIMTTLNASTTSKPLTTTSLYGNGFKNNVLKIGFIIYWALYIISEEAMCDSWFVLSVEMNVVACQ
jgi:hypothetical protein